MIRQPMQFRLIAFISLALLAAAMALAGCGSNSTASPPAKPARTAWTRHAQLPNNPPDIQPDRTNVPSNAAPSLRLNSAAPVPYSTVSGLAAATTWQTITFSGVAAGNEMQAFQDLYAQSQSARPQLTNDQIVATLTQSNITHTFTLSHALITTLEQSAVTAQGTPTIATLVVNAATVTQTS